MRAARLKKEIQIVAINDPFIPVDYMKYMFYVRYPCVTYFMMCHFFHNDESLMSFSTIQSTASTLDL